ncbi:hypothetical protein K2173_015188 [Erythroxylum novogranatense]|uniref:DUF7734 domain-containing protein n=1 Tax=Erythroxylum novogranatense TaxID=1862640 RepID=A0AAV8T183_9ROSI|nr:hypothetical protein K2173_015188 [Erythroxylum novogranatense]
MLKQQHERFPLASCLSNLPFLISKLNPPLGNLVTLASTTIKRPKLTNIQRPQTSLCSARRRVRYEEEPDNDEEEYGHNEDLASLELYSQSARGEALVVHADLDDQEVQVLIFKGFSSCLSFATSPDPSKSVLPARAIIKYIDRIRGPLDPSNIEYIEKGISWKTFQVRLNFSSR